MSTEDDRSAAAGSPPLGRAVRGSDRRRKRSFRLVERRTGFDRRRRYPLTVPLRDRPWLLGLILVVINLLSALDYLMTLLQLESGVATEGNPVLASLFDAGPAQAWMFKSGVMLLVTLGIWTARRHRSVLLVALGTLVLYAALIAYHLLGMRAVGLI